MPENRNLQIVSLTSRLAACGGSIDDLGTQSGARLGEQVADKVLGGVRFIEFVHRAIHTPM